MMKLKLVTSLLLLCLAFSCNNDDQMLPEACQANPPKYYNFNEGSYWIYQWSTIDTLGNETLMSSVDTIRNVGDTLINGNTYNVSKGTYLGTNSQDLYTRDSSGYLVNEDGRILFSAINFTDTLYTLEVPIENPQFTGAFQMHSDSLFMVDVPAGSFDCLNLQGHFINELSSAAWDIRTSDSFFAAEVGEVLSTTFYASSANTLVRRLVDFSLE